MDTPKKLLTTSAVARRIGISQQRVQEFVKEGRLAVALETPLGRLFDSAAVDKFCTERKRLITRGHVQAAKRAKS